MLAAGLMARRGLRVAVLEKNDKTLLKLGITGKGRCNLTNDASARDCVAAATTNGRFLYSALNEFPPADVMAFFEGLGVPLKTERGGRVFPASDRALDVVYALRAFVKRSGASVVRGRAEAIVTENGAVSGVRFDGGEIRCRAALLATGGMSYPATGSTGDGYAIAEKLGHTIVPPRPSLVPLTSPDGFCADMQGVSLRNVRLRAYEGDKLVFDEQGELLFTHFGLSGPLVLSASAHLRDFSGDKCHVSIDLKPALDERKLDARILRDFEKFSNRDFQNALGELAPSKMIPVLVRRSGIPPETKVHSVTRAQRLALVRLFKDFSVRISGARPVEEAIVTSGGVDVREVDPKTMASKLVPGLYFAGEILDVDAYTGGYNLQIAWATAHAAAGHIEF